LAWDQHWIQAPELNVPTAPPRCSGLAQNPTPTCCIWRPLCRLYCSCTRTLAQLFRPALQRQAAAPLARQLLLCRFGPVLDRTLGQLCSTGHLDTALHSMGCLGRSGDQPLVAGLLCRCFVDIYPAKHPGQASRGMFLQVGDRPRHQTNACVWPFWGPSHLGSAATLSPAQAHLSVSFMPALCHRWLPCGSRCTLAVLCLLTFWLWSTLEAMKLLSCGEYGADMCDWCFRARARARVCVCVCVCSTLGCVSPITMPCMGFCLGCCAMLQAAALSSLT
jgi:hypothetical protein